MTEANLYPLATWRFLHTPPAHGAWNMAVDQAILEAIGMGNSLPTLRLYAWSPPCLSLGYTQPVKDADLGALARHGWELVRRPTGGRAILHTDEITYAVIGPQDEPRLVGSVLESYRRLAEALLEMLHRLEVPAEALPGYKTPTHPPGGGQNPVCFEAPSNYEITVRGKKLIGSAQARRREGVLQHGSLPLRGDLSRIVQALNFPDEASRREAGERLLTRAATVEELLGRPISWTMAAQAFAEAFAVRLNLTFQPGELTASEQARAAELVEGKYKNMDWTGRL